MRSQTPIYGQDYKAGQVYFVFDDMSIISNGIAWFEYRLEFLKVKNKVSHCGIVCGENQGIAALTKGIGYEDLNSYFSNPHKHIFFREPYLLDGFGPDHIVRWCKNNIGKKYDFRLFIACAIVNSTVGKWLSERIRFEILRCFDAKDRYICSEFVTAALYYNRFYHNDNFRLMPSEILMSGIFKDFKYPIET